MMTRGLSDRPLDPFGYDKFEVKERKGAFRSPP